jgi:CRISPR-associated protein Csx3
MAKPLFTVVEDKAGYRLVKFEIPGGGVCTPEEFAEAVREVEDFLPGDKVILINGRGPVWGYGMLVHAAHPTPAIATYDPRLLGYVVVATHSQDYSLGQVIPDPEA